MDIRAADDEDCDNSKTQNIKYVVKVKTEAADDLGIIGNPVEEQQDLINKSSAAGGDLRGHSVVVVGSHNGLSSLSSSSSSSSTTINKNVTPQVNKNVIRSPPQECQGGREAPDQDVLKGQGRSPLGRSAQGRSLQGRKETDQNVNNNPSGRSPSVIRREADQSVISNSPGTSPRVRKEAEQGRNQVSPRTVVTPRQEVNGLDEEMEEDFATIVTTNGPEEDTGNRTYCLICGLHLEDDMETDDGGDLPDFDRAKYEQFLTETLQIDTASREEEDSDGSNFCQECQQQIIRLCELHSSMKEAVKLYDEERDKVALNIVSTFLNHSKPIDDFPAELHKESVTKRWKKVYTGEDRKEREIYKLVKERELKVASRVKRFQKLKGSFRARNAVLDVKDAKRIQQKMTSIYFTPKPQVIRKRRQMFLRVAIPNSEPSPLLCPICDKSFKHVYSLTIHLRSHAAESGKLYKCSICDKVCSTRQQLMHHRKEDHSDNEKLFKCDVCDDTFTSRVVFKTHCKTHVEIKSFSCEICGKEYPSSYFLKKHMNSHENVDFSVTDLFSCKTCSKTFLRSQELSDHLKIHDDSKLFGCEYCGKAFSDEETFKQHQTIHEGGNPYVCEECGSRYASEALLVSHLKIHRPKGHVCRECGKACRSRDGLRKHQLIHTGKKPFSCHICNIGFIERKSFDAHMVKHTGKLPYKCNYCKPSSEEGFKDAKDLRRHKVLKHPEFVPTDRKYTCDFCWNGFSTQEIMEEHKRKIHERYKCQHCHRVFKLGDHLRRHMYIHTGEKPYKCALCEKSFNQESNLKEHMYRHTGIRPHRCPHCPGVGYLRRMHLKEHMVKEHGTDKVPTLPMGRAAQNARRTGRHPVPTPVISGIKTEPMMDNYSNDQPEILVSSSNPSNCIILLQSSKSGL